MSADILNRAARLMRERAVAATAPRHPWALDEDDTAVRARRGAGPTVATTIPLGYEERRANAEHIASWHPGVALAFADYLDWMAGQAEIDPSILDGLTSGRLLVAAALAYLGEYA